MALTNRILPDTLDVITPDFCIHLGDAAAVAVTTGTRKFHTRVPANMTLIGVSMSLNVASSSGIPTIDINKNGTTVLSTKLTVDQDETTSATAAAAAVISVPSFAEGDEVSVDVDVAGTNATGISVWLRFRLAQV